VVPPRRVCSSACYISLPVGAVSDPWFSLAGCVGSSTCLISLPVRAGSDPQPSPPSGRRPVSSSPSGFSAPDERSHGRPVSDTTGGGSVTRAESGVRCMAVACGCGPEHLRNRYQRHRGSWDPRSDAVKASHILPLCSPALIGRELVASRYVRDRHRPTPFVSRGVRARPAPQRAR
jgi:hypothetical protein